MTSDFRPYLVAVVTGRDHIGSNETYCPSREGIEFIEQNWERL